MNNNIAEACANAICEVILPELTMLGNFTKIRIIDEIKEKIIATTGERFYQLGAEICNKDRQIEMLTKKINRLEQKENEDVRLAYKRAFHKIKIHATFAEGKHFNIEDVLKIIEDTELTVNKPQVDAIRKSDKK